MERCPQDPPNCHILCITVVSPLLGWPGTGSRPCLCSSQERPSNSSYTINSFKFSFDTCHDTFWQWGIRNVCMESKSIPALQSRSPGLGNTPFLAKEKGPGDSLAADLCVLKEEHPFWPPPLPPPSPAQDRYGAGSRGEFLPIPTSALRCRVLPF